MYFKGLMELSLKGVTPDAVKRLQNNYLMISVSIFKFISENSKDFCRFDDQSFQLSRT